ncbi:hypothetical protein F4808DRAFT_421998 [Astrocystis sublimbata]|nr:hypothetical protein F4808DRAFT_421998 [Astrocystis sublimbata]
MEDLRDAHHTVKDFAKWIELLQPDSNNTTAVGKRPELYDKRRDSGGSQRSTRVPSPLHICYQTQRWMSFHQHTRCLLHRFSEMGSSEAFTIRPAHNYFKIDQTALKEYISAPEMMDLGSEFVRHYYKNLEKDKPYWVAEDLFFNLQTVKQGDKDPELWAGARVYKRDWDLSDHIIRFVLLSDQFRTCSGQPKWAGWDWEDFGMMVGFYLNVLRCYTTREAKKRQLAGCSTSPPPMAQVPDRSKSQGHAVTRKEAGGKGEEAKWNSGITGTSRLGKGRMESRNTNSL